MPKLVSPEDCHEKRQQSFAGKISFLDIGSRMDMMSEPRTGLSPTEKEREPTMSNTKHSTSNKASNKFASAFKAYKALETQQQEVEKSLQEAVLSLLDANEGQKSFEGPDGVYYTIREYKNKETDDSRHVLVAMREAPAALRAKSKKDKAREQMIEGLRRAAKGDEKKFQKLLSDFESASEEEVEEETEAPRVRAKATGTHGRKSDISDDIEA